MAVASIRPLGTLTRAAMPMPATIVAQTRDTTTIFRWVPRSAVNIEELFMASSQASPTRSNIGRRDQEKGSREVTRHAPRHAIPCPSGHDPKLPPFLDTAVTGEAS